MDHSAEFLRCLRDVDIVGIRKLWAYTSPHLYQPDDHQALVSIHYARTVMDPMELKLRAYSHRWLLDNGYPSGLPDELKPKAERMYPRIVEGVGISVNASSEFMQPVADEIRKSMEYAVEEAYADGKTEVGFVKLRMEEARRRTRMRLLGKMLSA